MSRLSLYVNEQGRCVRHYSGFSTLAGITLVIWALQRRLYALAGIALLYGIAYNVVVVSLGPAWQWAALVAQFLVFGAFANRLHLWLLERGGWELTAQESPPPGGDAS